MKNILVIVGAGNKFGNTSHLSDAFIQGATEAGNVVGKVILSQDIQGCRGCLACQFNGGKCIIQDSMQSIYPQFEKADMVVLASPLYFFSLSARIKSFIDRLYAISKDDKYPKKEAVLLMRAGSKASNAFEQAVSFYRFLTRGLGWEDKGMVLANGCKGDIKNKNVPETFLEEAYLLGKSIK